MGLLGFTYPTAEMSSVYFTDPARWVDSRSLWISKETVLKYRYHRVIFLLEFFSQPMNFSTERYISNFFFHLKILILVLVVWLGFDGISTFVGYLTPNPFLCK